MKQTKNTIINHEENLVRLYFIWDLIKWALDVNYQQFTDPHSNIFDCSKKKGKLYM